MKAAVFEEFRRKEDRQADETPPLADELPNPAVASGS
jgi:hypothetical protein